MKHINAPSRSHKLETIANEPKIDKTNFSKIKLDNIEAPIPIDKPEENLLKLLKGSEININANGINALKKINSAKFEFPNIIFPHEQTPHEANLKNILFELPIKGIKKSPQAPIKIPSLNGIEPTNLSI